MTGSPQPYVRRIWFCQASRHDDDRGRGRGSDSNQSATPGASSQPTAGLTITSSFVSIA
jgi:hypothetical protein